MTLELSLVLGFIFHLIGDYLFQNDWMAQNKTKWWFPASIHALTYSFLFLFICHSYWWFLILVSHYLIDRYRIAVYWIKLVNWNWNSENFGYGPEKPSWMSVWLMIIIDNVWHVLLNSAAIFLSY